MNILSKISHYKIVKILYVLYTAVFMFIIEFNVLSVINKNLVGIEDLLILIILGITIEYLNSKEKKVKFIFLVVLMINLIYSVVFNLILMKGDSFFIIFVLNIIYIVIYNNFNEDNIDSYNYKESGKKLSLVLILVSMFFYRFLDYYEKAYITKAYLIYIISYILLLRESRRFMYKLYKKEEIINIFLCIAIIIFMFTSVFNKIFNFILSIGMKIFEVATYFIASIIYYVFGGFITNIFRKIFGLMKKSGESQNENTSPIKLIEEFMKGTKQKELHDTWFIVLVYIIVIIAFLILVIYCAKKFRNKIVKKDGFIEIREKVCKINYSKNKEKNFNDYSFNKAEKTIFSYYKKFLKISFKKKLYKKYMTARQVNVMVNTKIPEKNKELKILTDIYNEAKFSKHHLTEEHTKNVENAYKNIEKPLKNI